MIAPGGSGQLSSQELGRGGLVQTHWSAVSPGDSEALNSLCYMSSFSMKFYVFFFLFCFSIWSVVVLHIEQKSTSSCFSVSMERCLHPLFQLEIQTRLSSEASTSSGRGI